MVFVNEGKEGACPARIGLNVESMAI